MDADRVTREINIKHNLQSYLPYIFECVDSTHLLQHLDCFTSEHRREINQLKQVNPARATQKAFDALMTYDTPGLFTAVLHSLEEDFPKIVKLLKGDVVKWDDDFRRIVNLFTKTVINEIRPLELLLPLRNYNVLTAEEAEETRAEARNYGETRAASYILTNIHRHIEDWFKYFIMSLIETDHEDLAMKLDEEIVRKIKAQAACKSDDENEGEEKEINEVREHVLQVRQEARVSVNTENAPSSNNEACFKVLYNRVDTKIENVALPIKGAYTKEIYKRTNLENQIADCNLDTSENIYDEEQNTYYNNLDEFDNDDDPDDVTELKKIARESDEAENPPVANTDNVIIESSDIDDDLDDSDTNDLDTDPINIKMPDDDCTRNITTDLDELPNVAEHAIELRGYQKKLAKHGCEGENVIIMAPTNSGKTKVACQIVFSMFKHCEEQGKKGKAAFIVEREDLAIQQGEVFCKELPAYRTKVVTGEIQQNRDQYLKDYIDRRDVFVVTAQVLLNFLKSEAPGKLNLFDIIVFDECHHTDKKHPYKKIMDDYFELRLTNDGIPLPQIVGLTASIGVGGKLDRNIAFENMKMIAANLDAKVLCTVDNEDDQAEMKGFLNDPDEKTVEVERRSSERFYEDIKDTLERIDTFITNNPQVSRLEGSDKFMKAVSRVPTSSVGTPQFQSWISDFRRGLAVLKCDNARQILSPCLDYLNHYHIAVQLYTDARIRDALESLRTFVDERRQADYHNEADQFLMQHFDDLRAKSYREEPENPKLLKLKGLIHDTIGNDKNGRGIIFVKTRQLAKILKKWMHQTPELKHLNANAYLGKAASRGEGGSTKRNQKDVIVLFKNGRHQLIIATTVAEEGLDIGKCNLVIKYEHVTNEKARVQCKGRLRARNSKYFVLTEKGSKLIEKEEFNTRCERLMEELLPTLKTYMDENRNRWEGEILQKQRYAKEVREAQSRQRQAVLTDDIVNLHCGNCGTFICSSEDVKKICGMHHIVVTDVRGKIVLEKSLKPRHVDKTNEIIMGGNVFCSKPMCVYKYKIGGIVHYKMMDFPVLAIKNICIKTVDGEMLPNAKQWSKVAFKVESIDTADLSAIIQQYNVEDT